MSNVLNINIIGNGFDKMHGVDSTYFDFLEYLNNNIVYFDSNYIFKEMYQKRINDTWIDCEDYLNKLFCGFVKFKENKLNVEITDDVDTFINYANNKYGELKKDGNGNRYKLGDIVNMFKKQRTISYYSIIENEILKNIGTSETFLIDKMESDLLDDFYELRKELINYLKERENNFCLNNKFKYFLENNNFNENSICLNFNYTNTATKYFENIHHIHGVLEKENIVWGYYNCSMENICKSWQILCLNAGNKFFNELSMISRPRYINGVNINIFGHSICDNDRALYTKIMETIVYELSLIENGEYIRDDFPICINYTYYDDEKQLGKDQISKVKNIKELGPIASYVINRQSLNGVNTKYEFS